MNQQVPPWAMDENRIDINLIAMLLWQSLLTGVGVAISHLDWYLPEAGPGEMGLQYGLICFGFLCVSMVMFHVGGLRDSLAMRAEFAQESRLDKWYQQQMRLQQRRMRKEQQRAYDSEMMANGQDPRSGALRGPNALSQFGIPNAEAQKKDDVSQ